MLTYTAGLEKSEAHKNKAVFSISQEDKSCFSFDSEKNIEINNHPFP